MEKMKLGTREWGDATDGVLSAGDKFTLITMLIRSQLREACEGLLSATPLFKKRLSRINPNEIIIPDSEIAKRTIEKAKEEFDPLLLAHSYRTFWWGALLAQADKLTFDTELLFVAALLHDLGISPGGKPQSHACCFAIDGARQAESFLKAHKWDPHKSVKVADAISLHINPIVDASTHFVEAQLLSQGAMMDVIGARRRSLTAAAFSHVHAAYPRDGFKTGMVASIKAPHCPGSRADFMGAGFAGLAAKNPLDDRCQDA